MEEEEYVHALRRFVPPRRVFFPRESCLLCSHGFCILEHAEHEDTDGDYPCYICLLPTDLTDALYCSYSQQHRLHHHCLKQQRLSTCYLCNSGSYGQQMNDAAALHALLDSRHHHQPAPPPADEPTSLIRSLRCVMLCVLLVLLLQPVVYALR